MVTEFKIPNPFLHYNEKNAFSKKEKKKKKDEYINVFVIFSLLSCMHVHDSGL